MFMNTNMTENKLEIVKLRLQGMTYAQIAKRYMVSKQYIELLVNEIVFKLKTGKDITDERICRKKVRLMVKRLKREQENIILHEAYKIVDGIEKEL